MGDTHYFYIYNKNKVSHGPFYGRAAVLWVFTNKTAGETIQFRKTAINNLFEYLFINIKNTIKLYLAQYVVCIQVCMDIYV